MSQLDLSGDWIVVDNLQTVVYFSRIQTNSFDGGHAFPNVLKRAVDKDELSALGLLHEEVSYFHIWMNQTGGIVPKVSDKLIDNGGIIWIVNEVQIQTFNTRYRLTTIKAK